MQMGSFFSLFPFSYLLLILLSLRIQKPVYANRHFSFSNDDYALLCW